MTQQAQTALVGLYTTAAAVILAGVVSIRKRFTRHAIQAPTVARQLRVLLREVDKHLTEETPRLVGEIVATVEPPRVVGPPPVQPPTLPPGVPPSEPFDFTVPKGVRSADAIRRDLESELQDVRFRITRLDDDLYKAVVGEHTPLTVGPRALTSSEAQQRAFADLVSRGVTGFTDKSGRRWNLASYVEMAVRTAALRSQNDATVQVIRALHINLVTVTDDGHPCPLCQPWQWRVLALEPDGTHPTVADATAAGLFHPNCKHAIVAVTDPSRLPDPTPWTEDDADKYKATQKLRSLERAVRSAKQDLLYADPSKAAAARRDVRDAQAAIRQFLKDHPGLLRRRRREQINLGYL